MATHVKVPLSGFLGWLWRFRMLGRTVQSRGLVRLFDRVILPVQLRLERALPLPVGQSVTPSRRSADQPGSGP